MSKLPERTDKICLNCDTILHGRYCHVCSQENLEPQQPFWHVIFYFLIHFTHLDTKTFRTLKCLFVWPGFLSEEYKNGRRAKYVDPLKLYMTISALLFVCIFALHEKKPPIKKETHPEVVCFIDSVRANVKMNSDQTDLIQATVKGRKVYIYLWEDEYTHGMAYYDSLQQAIPPDEKENFIAQWFDRKNVLAYEKYNKDPYNANSRLWDNIFLSVSKVFFISMPVFVFFLYLLYIRKRREFYFISHTVFALHFYCIIWFFLLIGIVYKKILTITGADNFVIQLLAKFGPVFCILGGALYLFLAMHRFYKQSRGKTIMKTVILSVLTVSLLIFEVMIIWLSSYGFL